VFDALWQDLRYATRALWTTPAFAAVAILSLGLGIGANTAIFSLIDALILKTIPVSHPEELLQVTMATPEYFTNPIWEQIRDRQDVFSGIFAYGLWRFDLAAGGEARYVNGHYSSGQYFDTLGVRAALGRTLTPADDKRGCAGAAVLGHGFWQREYGGRADVLGRTISLNSHPIEIVGVADPRFTGIDVGSTVDVLVPLCAEKILHGESTSLDFNAAPGSDRYLYSWLRLIGRPKAGVAPDQARARLKTLAPQIYEATVPRNWRIEDQDEYLHRTLDTQPAANGLSYLREQYRQALMILLAVTGVVLLIACANVANLLFARGTARRREIAIRMALGCGRGRVVRQLLVESLLLSAAGAALGVLFATWGTRLLVRSISNVMDGGYTDVFLDLTPDIRVLAFTMGVAILTGLLFGIAPALRASGVQPLAAMKANSRGVIEGARFGLGKVLVMAQVALSLVLVAGAGLLLSTFWKLASLNPGFDPAGILLAGIDLRNSNYSPERKTAAFQEILAKLRAIPGAQSASMSDITPICRCEVGMEVEIAGYAAQSREDATIEFNRVSDRYFETLGTRMVAGRDFDDRDTRTSPRVAIINQIMAKKYFGVVNPLGHTFRVWDANILGDPIEIIGIVKDSKYGSLREDIRPTASIEWSQKSRPGPQASFELRATRGAPADLITAVKSAIGEVDPNVSIEFSTLANKVHDSLARERLLATLSGFFGALALLLAAIGLYGVMSYNVARRRNEIGIRIALGAEQARVLRMVLGEVSLLIVIGIAAGLGVAFATTRLVASFLYGLPPNDPVTLFLAAAILAGAAFLAGYLPARRASLLDPMTALREE
jgi:putative ABC transport system permease protein